VGEAEIPQGDGVLRLETPVFDEDPLSRLGQQTSHPPGLLSGWFERYGPDEASRLACHDLVHPPIIVNGAPAEPGSGLADHEEPGFAVLDGPTADLEAVLAAVAATDELAPDLIVEVCAGRGTKTRQLAQVHPQARIVASDASPHRLAGLRELFGGHDRVLVVEPVRPHDAAAAGGAPAADHRRRHPAADGVGDPPLQHVQPGAPGERAADRMGWSPRRTSGRSNGRSGGTACTRTAGSAARPRASREIRRAATGTGASSGFCAAVEVGRCPRVW
jgi:hypothetical protein